MPLVRWMYFFLLSLLFNFSWTIKLCLSISLAWCILQCFIASILLHFYLVGFEINLFGFPWCVGRTLTPMVTSHPCRRFTDFRTNCSNSLRARCNEFFYFLSKIIITSKVRYEVISLTLWLLERVCVVFLCFLLLVWTNSLKVDDGC